MDARSGRLDNSMMLSHAKIGSVSKSPLRTRNQESMIPSGNNNRVKSSALNLTSVFIGGEEEEVCIDGKSRTST